MEADLKDQTREFVSVHNKTTSGWRKQLRRLSLLSLKTQYTCLSVSTSATPHKNRKPTTPHKDRKPTTPHYSRRATSSRGTCRGTGCPWTAGRTPGDRGPQSPAGPGCGAGSGSAPPLWAWKPSPRTSGAPPPCGRWAIQSAGPACRHRD